MVGTLSSPLSDSIGSRSDAACFPRELTPAPFAGGLPWATLLAVAPAAEVPASDDWLAPAERAVAAGLRVERRRGDWRAGRWAAKRALAARLGLTDGELARLAVLAAADGAPVPTLDGGPLDLAVSLSHRAGVACAAVVAAPGRVGCDLERIEPRSDAFVADYFTAAERWAHALVAPAERSLHANLVWSGKESALKLLRVGLSVDTREVDVEVDPALLDRTDRSWLPFQVSYPAVGESFTGVWRRLGELVVTLVATPR